jgi:D-alanyl-D-alanine endopeptidase (penicillin-binding protein 7)
LAPFREIQLGGRILALLAGCALAAQAIGAQQAAIEQRLRPDAVVRAAGGPNLKSTSALVLDQSGQRVLYAKNVDWVVPIASITKLMTAMVVLDSGLPLDEPIKITRDDRDGLKGTRSRLAFGMSVRRDDLLRLALMASENRAAAALARAYPGGTPAFVRAMNRKAAELGMWHSRFVDGTGLSNGNVSNAQDLARLVSAAHRYPLIREYTTDSEYTMRLANGHKMQFMNSNRLVRSASWDIGLSKTGYISEAGRCLVMQATIASMPVVIVLLDSWGHLSRIGDANRIKKWMESNASRMTAG